MENKCYWCKQKGIKIRDFGITLWDFSKEKPPFGQDYGICERCYENLRRFVERD